MTKYEIEYRDVWYDGPPKLTIKIEKIDFQAEELIKTKEKRIYPVFSEEVLEIVKLNEKLIKLFCFKIADSGIDFKVSFNKTKDNGYSLKVSHFVAEHANYPLSCNFDEFLLLPSIKEELELIEFLDLLCPIISKILQDN